MFEPLYDFLYNFALGTLWVAAGFAVAGLTVGLAKAFSWLSTKLLHTEKE